MNLAGYAAALEEHGIETTLIAIALEGLAEGEAAVAVADVLRQAAADARTSAEAGRASSQAVAAAIDSAVTRLASATGNPLSQADADAILADLQAAKTANDEGVAADQAAAGVADTIDPAVATAGVVDDGSGGVTEPAP